MPLHVNEESVDLTSTLFPKSHPSIKKVRMVEPGFLVAETFGGTHFGLNVSEAATKALLDPNQESWWTAAAIAKKFMDKIGDGEATDYSKGANKPTNKSGPVAKDLGPEWYKVKEGDYFEYKEGPEGPEIFPGELSAKSTFKQHAESVLQSMQEKMEANTTLAAKEGIKAALEIKLSDKVKKSPHYLKKKFNPSNPVDLRDAEELYQAVKGTSGGAVYYVVGLSKHVKVAARIKHSSGDYTLSFRVDGKGLKSYEAAAKLAGLETTAGSHMSMHASVYRYTQLAMALGAINMAVAATQAPYPDPDELLFRCKVIMA